MDSLPSDLTPARTHELHGSPPRSVESALPALRALHGEPAFSEPAPALQKFSALLGSPSGTAPLGSSSGTALGPLAPIPSAISQCFPLSPGSFSGNVPPDPAKKDSSDFDLRQQVVDMQRQATQGYDTMALMRDTLSEMKNDLLAIRGDNSDLASYAMKLQTSQEGVVAALHEDRQKSKEQFASVTHVMENMYAESDARITALQALVQERVAAAAPATKQNAAPMGGSPAIAQLCMHIDWGVYYV